MLDWYCKSYKAEVEYLPVCNGGPSFRKKWIPIEEAYGREKAQENEERGEDDKIGKPIVRIIGRATEEEAENWEENDGIHIIKGRPTK